jgi:small-conductance mechanosensitive channel
MQTRLPLVTLFRVALVASSSVVAVCLTPSSALTQQDTVQVPTITGAPVVHRGDTLFLLYGTIGPFTALERARALERRIRSIADDPLLRADAIVVIDTAGAVDIQLDTMLVMTVTDRDALEAGETRLALADRYAEAIRGAVQRRQGAASLKTILVGAALTLIAAAGLVAILLLINRFFPLIYRFIRRGRGRWIRSLRIQRLEVLSVDRAVEVVLFGARLVRVAAFVVVIYVFLPIVFSFFPWTRGLAGTLFGWVLDPLQQVGEAFVAYLPNLFTVAVVVVVFYYFLKFIHLFFTGIQRGAISFPGFHRDWAIPTYKIVRFLVIVFAVIIIFPYLPGSQTPAFRGISIFLGVLISFGSSSAIANVVAGAVIIYMRPFQIGDRVKIADTIGDVIERTLLVTRVRTPKNVDITIPNAMVLASHIINYSSTAKDGGVILHTGVTLGYDVPWRRVHELLIAAAKKTDSVLEDPGPFVHQASLDDFSVSYELNAYTESPNAMARIYSDLHQHIQDVFNEAGVEIMSPHYRAVRDGNRVAIPADHLSDAYQAPSFTVKHVGGAREITPDAGPA